MARNNVKIIITVDDKGTPQIKRFASGAKKDLGGVEQKAVASAKAMKTAWLAAAAALGAIAAGAIAMTNALIEAASTTEQYRVRLKTLLGSQSEGNRLFEEMADLAGKVPFEYEKIMGSATQLAGVMSGGVDEVKQWMPLIADLAAATGISIEDTTGQIVRMYSAGAASADLFRERGVTAMLGFQAGVSVSAEETRKRLIEAWEEPTSKFRGATDELAKTWVGATSMMGDQWFRFKNLVADMGPFETAKEGVGLITEALTAMNANLEIARERAAGATEQIIWMGEATTTMLQISSAAAAKLELEGAFLGAGLVDPEKFAAAYAAAEEAKNAKVAEMREAQAVKDRTKEEAQAIELQERSIMQATELAEEKLRIETERMNAEIEAEKLKEAELEEMRATAVIQNKEAAEQRLRDSIARDNAEIESEKKRIESDRQMTKQWMEQSLAMAASQNKKAWRLYQAYRISEAIVDTIEAAQASYRWGASWGGPIAGGIMAAIATAAGVMRVAQIAGEKPKAREGGVFSGPSSGYDAELHGTEAVVPLPGGRSIPVETAGGGLGGPQVNLTIQAMDTESANEFLERNPQAVIGPLMTALQSGHRGLTTTIKETTQTN